MEAHKSPVMADVAQWAGVSHQTVSRVLNEPDIVRPQTQERVLEAIEALGYRRNLSARALVTNRTRLIGVVNPSIMRFGPSHTTMAIQEAARAAGYATISSGTEDAAASPHAALEFFLNLAVDGLIVVAPTMQIADATRELAGTLPIVIIAAGLKDPAPLHVVAVDHEYGAREATRHLIEQGHETIAHVSGPANWFDARARLGGWRSELTHAGLLAPPVISGGWDAGQGYEAATELLQLRPRPTAVFAANDLLALGLMSALHEAGLTVPDDMAVVGYDDVSGSDFYTPPLTTLRQPFSAVGGQAMQALLSAMGGTVPEGVLIHPTLVVRHSSGRPH